MDQKSAWSIFTASGKVEDYIRFRQIAREEDHTESDVDKESKRSKEKDGEQAWLNRLP